MDDDRRVNVLGDTAEHAWMLEFLERCFPESENRVNGDFNLAMEMCKAEPKHAQVGMQWLAQEIRSGNHDQERLSFFRFSLGVLFMAYAGLAAAEGRCAPGEVPPELEFALKHNPEIIACANEVGEFKFLGDKND
jgi:hypothetical protein